MYNITKPFIEYKDNREYRAVLRDIFEMNPPDIKCSQEMDSETLDELLFDDLSVLKNLEDLFNKTHKHPIFSELYVLAAGKLLSTEKHVGQVILFSYDYLFLFHPLICLYSNNPIQLDNQCEYYMQLKTKLSKR